MTVPVGFICIIELVNRHIGNTVVVLEINAAVVRIDAIVKDVVLVGLHEMLPRTEYPYIRIFNVDRQSREGTGYQCRTWQHILY